MDFIFKVLIIIYGSFDIIAGAFGLKYKKGSRLGSILMIVAGGMLIVVGITRNHSILNTTTLLGGLILTHIAAMLNGIKMYVNINKGHHIVRLIISLAMISLYLWTK
ncbi:hypothetical protein [Clostridium manihotivorum]|uniref:Uncharacterized protein n=1 Tax=Clostridium manihotivorum TaxID=2320868 RepID=A0A410DYX2_9CLOT|nr:hypothetical protein [Clostridium manihotivorum]QAA34258.1 hypothetical protein C1I91_22905 [Clostridium manihotivorum]